MQDGDIYRSKHELVAAFEVGRPPHTNTLRLGDKRRYRTNLWSYPAAAANLVLKLYLDLIGSSAKQNDSKHFILEKMEKHLIDRPRVLERWEEQFLQKNRADTRKL